MSDLKVVWRVSTSYFLNVRHHLSAAHGRGNRSRRGCLLLAMAAVVFLTAGCEKPDYPSKVTPSLYPTISSDGKMVVTIDDKGKNHPRLTIYRLGDGTVQAETVNAPPWTYGIRFGLQGHDLLVTHFVGDRWVSDLLKWNLDKLLEPPEQIFRALRVEFPLEISPGIYLVKTSKPSEKDPGTSDIYSGYRRLISRKEILKSEIMSPTFYPSRTSAWPNYVEGKGFFWMYGDKPKEPPFFPKIAYPDGDGPDLAYLESVYEKNTTSIKCDYHGKRCLRQFIAGKQADGASYDYDLEVLYGRQRCPLDMPELAGGWIDNYELTPDGNTAVVTLSDNAEAPLRGIVIRFKEGQSAPVSVQTLFDRREKP